MKYSNKFLEDIWSSLEDIPIEEKENGTFELDSNWFVFPKGTTIYEIWMWSDKKYKGGIEKLIHS